MAAVLLAAGASRRMGRAKQLLIAPGTGGLTLVAHAAAMAATAGLSPVVAVVGARAGEVAAALGPGVEAVLNPDWAAGPGTSVATGVRHVIDHHPEASAVLLTPIDLPRVTADDLRRLISAAAGSPAGASAAAFDDSIGAPAVLDRRHFAALLALPPERGAGALLRAIGATPVDLPAAADDIDRPEDYRRLCKAAAAGNGGAG